MRATRHSRALRRLLEKLHAARARVADCAKHQAMAEAELEAVRFREHNARELLHEASLDRREAQQEVDALEGQLAAFRAGGARRRLAAAARRVRARKR